MSIIRVKKECVECGDMKFIFSGGRCGYCYGRGKKVAVGVKARIKRAARVTGDRDFFMSVWSSREHHCEECEKLHGSGLKSYLGNEPKSYMFSHLLSKGAHPKLRHVDLNISLSCLDHHSRYEFGRRTVMEMYSEWEDRKIELLEIERGI